MMLSVVIPVYNGETTIAKLNYTIRKELQGSFSYKIIMVCDPGEDNSAGVIRSIVNEFPLEAEAWFPEKRLGQHNAILYGISKSTSDFVVTMDDDLQHDPACIKELVQKQKEGDYDVVYAVFRNPAHSRVRNLASDLFRRLISRTIPGICPWYSPYRLIKGDLARRLPGLKKKYIFIDGLLGSEASKFGAIDAEHRKRNSGRSAYGLYRLVRHAVMILWYYP